MPGSDCADVMTDLGLAYLPWHKGLLLSLHRNISYFPSFVLDLYFFSDLLVASEENKELITLTWFAKFAYSYLECNESGPQIN